GRAQGESVPLAALRTAPTGRGLGFYPSAPAGRSAKLSPSSFAGGWKRRPATSRSPPCSIGRAGGGLVFFRRASGSAPQLRYPARIEDASHAAGGRPDGRGREVPPACGR